MKELALHCWLCVVIVVVSILTFGGFPVAATTASYCMLIRERIPVRLCAEEVVHLNPEPLRNMSKEAISGVIWLQYEPLNLQPLIAYKYLSLPQSLDWRLQAETFSIVALESPLDALLPIPLVESVMPRGSKEMRLQLGYMPNVFKVPVEERIGEADATTLMVAALIKLSRYTSSSEDFPVLPRQNALRVGWYF